MDQRTAVKKFLHLADLEKRGEAHLKHPWRDGSFTRTKRAANFVMAVHARWTAPSPVWAALPLTGITAFTDRD
jgi:hypothetical protein